MNKPFYIFLLFCLRMSAQQNLIYNGDFEIYDTCPISSSGPFDLEIEHCLGWTVATWGTSDYYNICNNTIGFHIVGVPSNALGYQNAYNGVGYSGGFLYYFGDNTSGHYREYIQGSLLNTLQSGQKYNFSMQLSFANSSAMAIKKVSVVFSNTKIQQLSSWKPLTNIPNISISSSSFYTDSLNWVKLSGSFIATGTENYLTIGNFTDTLVTDTFRVIPYDADAPDYSAYYYIDDVKLYEANDSALNNINCNSNLPNVFTPNNDSVNDVLYLKTCSKIIKTTIYNRWGNIVFVTDKISYYWDGRTTSGEECSDGTYFYSIETKEKKYKGFVQLIR